MKLVSRLLRWPSTSRRWAVAGGVLAIFIAAYAWLCGLTAGGLDVYEACGLGGNAEPEVLVRRELPPLQLTCVFSDGSTRDLTPDWVNPVFVAAMLVGVFLLLTAYANVLVDAWQGPAPS